VGKEAQRLAAALGAHPVVALDTPVFIYHFEEHPRYSQVTIPLFRYVEGGGCRAVTSVLSRLEILVRPLQQERQDIADSYRFLLDTFPNLTQISVDEEVANAAALMRARSRLATPDSLHLASALHAGATLFVTNDDDFSKGIEGLEILLLDSLVRG